jgi:hypothetical protein
MAHVLIYVIHRLSLRDQVRVPQETLLADYATTAYIRRLLATVVQVE